jgi:hypothetical protein
MYLKGATLSGHDRSRADLQRAVTRQPRGRRPGGTPGGRALPGFRRSRRTRHHRRGSRSLHAGDDLHLSAGRREEVLLVVDDARLKDGTSTLGHNPSGSLRLDPDPTRAAWPTSVVARDVTYDGRRNPIAVIVSCIPESSVGWIAASSPARGVNFHPARLARTMHSSWPGKGSGDHVRFSAPRGDGLNDAQRTDRAATADRCEDRPTVAREPLPKEITDRPGQIQSAAGDQVDGVERTVVRGRHGGEQPRAAGGPGDRHDVGPGTGQPTDVAAGPVHQPDVTRGTAIAIAGERDRRQRHSRAFRRDAPFRACAGRSTANQMTSTRTAKS